MNKDIYMYYNKRLSLNSLYDLIVLQGRLKGKRYPKQLGMEKFIEKRIKQKAAEINKIAGPGGVEGFVNRTLKQLEINKISSKEDK